MIAFEIFWRPIYRYWIFYCITFLLGYRFLTLVPTFSIFESWKKFPALYTLLTKNIDDLFLTCIVWVLFWWRLWHVFFYEWYYYKDNLIEILDFTKWWMSFVWWIIWVVIWLFYINKRFNLTWWEFRLLWDIVLCIVPIGSLLWRIWNYLNQELIWRSIESFSSWRSSFFSQVWLTTTYNLRDNILRVNVNVIQSFWEWLLLLVIVRYIFLSTYKKWFSGVWLISWIYLLGYWCVRFLAEYLKELPSSEIYWIFSISQRMSITLSFIWVCLIYYVLSSKNKLRVLKKL